MKLNGIEYIPYNVEFLGESEDEGAQMVTRQSMCSRFECLEWNKGERFGPKLIRNEKGFRICPRCKCSWGP